MSEWKILDDEAGLRQLDNWMKHVISDRGLTGTTIRFLGLVHSYYARHNTQVCPIDEIVDTMLEHEMATRRTIARAFRQAIDRRYVLLVDDAHMRVNPKLADAPPAHWLEVGAGE